MADDNHNKTNQQHFPCEECGADLIYQPGTDALACTYCGHQNIIRQSLQEIREYSFEQALRAIQQGKLRPLDNTQVIKCPNCAAIFELNTKPQCG